MKQIDEKLKEIADVLVSREINDEIQYGLLAGTSGMAAFLLEYGKFTNQDLYTRAGMKLVERSIDLVMNSEPYHTHCSGIAGLAHFLIDLEKEKIFEDVISKEIDTYLSMHLENEIMNNHYDFLHGATGLIFYFIHRAERKKKLQTLVKNAFQYLDQTAEKFTANGVKYAKWQSHEFKSGDIQYNISLSHGIASIVGVLIHMYKASYLKEKEPIRELIESAVNYILAQRIDNIKYHSYFPYVALESLTEINPSRMAWCYGDLGIASIIWQAGKALDKQELKDFAIEVFRFSSTRKLPEDTQIVDAGFCHGTAGVAHIFQRMYHETGLPEMKEASSFWIDETLKMAYHEDGLAGYKIYHGTNDIQWIKDPYLLEGLSGIGMSLLSFRSGLTPTWDKYFLLS